MGIAFKPDEEGGEGVTITEVIAHGGAEKAGLRAGDLILEFDGAAVKSSPELIELIGRKAVNDPFRVRVLRQGEELDLTGTLGERPLDD